MSDSYAGKFENSDGVNTANNPYLGEIDATRRQLIGSSLAAVTLLIGTGAAFAAKESAMKTKGELLGFTSVPVSASDEIVVPPEYDAQVLYRWGDPVGAKLGSPAFKSDASNTWQEQSLQAGMHHDGMEYFPLSQNGNRGLLAINHEYTDDGLLHPQGMKNWSAIKVRKAQEAHGVSVIEVERKADCWKVLQNSKYARRITANTMMAIAGPAAGHKVMQTSYDPSGTRVLGTLNNCAAGQTPWGTFLTCEENWNGYFSTSTKPTPQELRYGMRNKGWGYQWHDTDTRFDSVVVNLSPKCGHQRRLKLGCSPSAFDHSGSTSLSSH